MNIFKSSTGIGTSRMWKGFAHGAIPAIILLAPFFGVDIKPEELNPIVDVGSDLIIAFFAVISSAEVIFGLVRKIVIRFRASKSS